VKILHITPEVPGRKSGGQICVLQSTEMLCSDKNNTIDYIGPAIDDKKIREFYTTIYELQASTSWIGIIVTLSHLVLNKRYISWKKLSKQLDFSRYDIVYLEFTKLHYVVKDIHRRAPKTKIIVRSHNVELDYASYEYHTHRTLIKFIIISIVKAHEKYILHNVNQVITLTHDDKRRLCDVYHISKDCIDVVPICIDEPMSTKCGPGHIDGKTHFLITGSLWYGANVEGIYWMFSEVLSSITETYALTIAGSRPNEKMRHLCNAHNITLIDTPDSMSDYLEWCDMVIVPIFGGSGMKVKIAEAMSYCKPVITTSYGAIGYDIQHGVNGFIADDAKTFAKSMTEYILMSPNEKEKIMCSAKALFSEKYETSRGALKLAEIINAMKGTEE